MSKLNEILSDWLAHFNSFSDWLQLERKLVFFNNHTPKNLSIFYWGGGGGGLGEKRVKDPAKKGSDLLNNWTMDIGGSEKPQLTKAI